MCVYIHRMQIEAWCVCKHGHNMCAACEYQNTQCNSASCWVMPRLACGERLFLCHTILYRGLVAVIDAITYLCHFQGLCYWASRPSPQSFLWLNFVIPPVCSVIPPLLFKKSCPGCSCCVFAFLRRTRRMHYFLGCTGGFGFSLATWVW